MIQYKRHLLLMDPNYGKELRLTLVDGSEGFKHFTECYKISQSSWDAKTAADISVSGPDAKFKGHFRLLSVVYEPFEEEKV